MSIILKINSILNIKQKYKLLLLLLFSLINAFVEMLSIGLIIPFIYLLVKPNSSNNKFLQIFMSNFSENIDERTIFLYGVIFFIFVYVSKSILVSIMIIFNHRISESINRELTDNLFKTYLYKDFIFHLKNNTSKLMRNVLSEIGHFADMISLILNIISEILVVFLIILLIFTVEPMGMISILLILSIFLIFYFLIFYKKFKKWGIKRQKADYIRIKSIQESLGSIKEMKIYNLENSFSKIQDIQNFITLRATNNAKIISSLNRPIFESLAIISVIIFFIVISHNSSHANIITEKLPILAMIGAAVFRILPAISSIYQKLQHIRFTIPALEAVYAELSKNNIFYPEHINNINKLNFDQSIILKNICFNYDIEGKIILDDISFKINKNQIFGISGKSGSGKSTLINIILGLLSPNSGDVLVDNINIKDKIKPWQNIMSYVPQNIYLYDNSIIENILCGSKLDQDKLDLAIKNSQLNNFLEKLPLGLDTKVGELGSNISGGEKQRIGIARALYRQPDVIVFDEATNALDVDTENEIIKSITNLKGKMTIILISHNQSLIKICDDYLDMNNLK